MSAGGFVYLGEGHTCARTLADNKIRCWGDDSAEQLGTGNGMPDVPGASALSTGGKFTDVTGIATGKGHACALTMAGSVHCWGLNDAGQLGDGTQDDRSSPKLVAQLPKIARLTVGGQHTCAVTGLGDVYCWGTGAPQPFAPPIAADAARIDGARDVAHDDGARDPACEPRRSCVRDCKTP